MQRRKTVTIIELPDWFISYENRKGQYVEENFERMKHAKARIVELEKQRIEAELWTRKRQSPVRATLTYVR